MSSNWKTVLHSAILGLASLLVGALEQYFDHGGAVPQNPHQWHAFISAIGGTLVLGIVAYLKQSPLNPQPPAPTPPSSTATKVVIILALCAGTAALTGCPANTTTLQKCATASNQAAIIVQGFNTAEITAHQQGLIPDADHQFIEQQVVSLGQMGKTADACIRGAGTNAAALVCINRAVATVDTINQQGGLYLKSDKAKSEFALVLAGVKAVLQSLTAVLGGSPAPAPSTAALKGAIPWIQSPSLLYSRS